MSSAISHSQLVCLGCTKFPVDWPTSTSLQCHHPFESKVHLFIPDQEEPDPFICLHVPSKSPYSETEYIGCMPPYLHSFILPLLGSLSGMHKNKAAGGWTPEKAIQETQTPLISCYASSQQNNNVLQMHVTILFFIKPCEKEQHIKTFEAKHIILATPKDYDPKAHFNIQLADINGACSLDRASEGSEIHQHQNSPLNNSMAIANSENPPEDTKRANEANDDDSITVTTDDDDENLPKKKRIIPTVRLSLELSRLPTPITFEGSFSVLAKEAGYVLPEDTAIKFGAYAVPEPESPPANTVQENGGPPPKRQRRRRILERDEGYEREDSFVDDSEALMMEPKFYHAPARDGFFMTDELLELKSDKKKTRKRKPTSKAAKRGPCNAISNHQSPKPMCESQVDQPSNSTLALPLLPNDLHDQGVPNTAHTSTSTKPTALSLPPTQSTLKDSTRCTTHLPPMNLIVEPTRTLGLQTNPIHILDNEEDRSSAPLTDASQAIS